jgi:hypothetical protein
LTPFLRCRQRLYSENQFAIFTERLEAAGYDCFETEHSDLLAVADDRVVLAEAKTLTPDSALRQVRSALGQLAEYHFFDVVQRKAWADRSTRVCLYVTPPPTGEFEAYLDWLPSQGIDVLWLGEDGVGGPSQALSCAENYEGEMT